MGSSSPRTRLGPLCDYDAFGAAFDVGHECAEGVAFAGERWDREAGQYRLRAWQYDPHTGRFTQPDPLGLAGGQNPYAYAANNPTTRADHSGYADEEAGPVPIGNRPAGHTGTGYTGKSAETGQGLYVLRDEEGTTRYIGIGDAPGRQRDHRGSGSRLNHLSGATIADNNLTYEEARGLEYLLIKRFGGPQKRNGATIQLLNRTGGIKPRNYSPQQFQAFIDAARPLLDETLKLIGR